MTFAATTSPSPVLLLDVPPPTASVPSAASASFSGHETFVFRYTWLKKGVDGFCADPDVFRRDNAIVTLGVGRNMVSSIRHWCLATQVLEDADFIPGTRARSVCVSRFGQFLFRDPDADGGDGHDPFLEDDGSLWLLHWNLTTHPTRATLWYWAFNLLRESEFTRDSLLDALTRAAGARGWGRVSEATLKNDISCFLRTYLPGRRGAASTAEESFDCPLTTLGLFVTVDGEGKARIRFNTKPKPSLPLSVWAYALAEFWNKRHAGQNTLSLREIVHGEGSPGRVFRLDEDATLAYLDGLDKLTGGDLTFTDTALVRQVVRRAPVEPIQLLHDYYAAR